MAPISPNPNKDVFKNIETDFDANGKPKQEKKTNNYLIDPDIPLSSKKQIIEYEFGDSIEDSGYYVLAVNGGN